MVVPWHDPVVDSVGFDVRSNYVELFWLNVLGPTATWALRRLVTSHKGQFRWRTPERNPYLIRDEHRPFLESRYADVAFAFSNA